MKVETIEQFKIKEWISANFETGALQVEYTSRNTAIATDRTGARMELRCKKGATSNYIVEHRFLKESE